MLSHSCKFNGIACSANNFTKFWDNNYRNCYTFNDAKLEKQKQDLAPNPHNYTNHYAQDNDARLASFLQSNTHGYDDGLQLQLAVSKILY